MKSKEIIFGLFLISLSCALCDDDEFITLIAPPVSHFSKPYETFLSTSSLMNDTNIVISFRSEMATFKIRRHQGKQKLSNIIEFKKGGLDNSADYNKSTLLGHELEIFANQGDKCTSKKAVIVQKPDAGLVFIQFDKPVYKPEDLLQFRVLAFNLETIPIAINNIRVGINDNEGNLIHHITNIDEVQQEFKDFGLYEGSFVLGKDLGTYKISAKINNNTRIYAEKTFTVQKFIVPFLELKLDAPAVVFMEERVLEFTIYSQHKFGKYASGTANISIKSNKDRQIVDEKIQIGAVKVIKSYNLRQDLGIYWVYFDNVGFIDITINVEFTDDSTNKTQRVSRPVRIKARKQPIITIVKPFPYTPGITYEVDVIVKEWNGKTIVSSSIPVYFTYRWINDFGGTKGVKTGNIENSVAKFYIDTTRALKKIKIEARYLDAKFSEEIVESLEEFEPMRVFVEPNYVTLHEKLQIRIESTQPLDEVIVLAIGPFGIAYIKRLDCRSEISCSLMIPTKRDMVPKVNIVVYSMNGIQVKSASTTVHFKQINENFLNITLQSHSASAKEIFNLKFDTEPDSIVSLLAVEKTSSFEGDGFTLDSREIIDRLTNLKKFANQGGLNENLPYDNHNYILSLNMTEWRNCTDEELKTIELIQKPRFRGPMHGGSFHKRNEVEPIVIEQAKNENPDPIKSSSSPNSWIWETFNVDGRTRLEKSIPDSTTSWLISGFSINKDSGIAIAEHQEVVVSQEFYIEVNAPPTIKLGEIVKIEVIVFNFVKSGRSLNVELKIDSIDENLTKQFEFIKNFECETISNNSLSETINAVYRQGTLTKFYIRPLANKDIKITVEAIESRGYKTFKDIIVKRILVEPEGIFYSNTLKKEFKLDNSTDSISFPFNAQEVLKNSIKFTAKVTGTSNETEKVDTNMDVEFVNGRNPDVKRRVNINNGNAQISQLIEMPRNTEDVIITATGHGYAEVTATYEYFKAVDKLSDHFELEVSSKSESGGVVIEACVTSKSNEVKGLIVMELSFPSGFAYVAKESNPMAQDLRIKNVETRRGDSIVDIFFSELPLNQKLCINVHAQKVYDVENLKKSSVKVFKIGKKDETLVARFYNVNSTHCNRLLKIIEFLCLVCLVEFLTC